MITTQINPSTFIVNGKTFTANQEIKLTTREQKWLERCVELSTYMTSTRQEIYTDCYTSDEVFDEKAAARFFEFDMKTKEHNYLAMQIVNTICERLGGLLPLFVKTDGPAPGVFVRALGNPQEQVLLTYDIIRQNTQFNRAVGDVRSIAASFPGGVVKDGLPRTACKVNNWPLMGCPYVTIKTKELPFQYNFCDSMTEFTWEAVDGTPIDTMLVNALSRALDVPGRIDKLRTGQTPFNHVIGLIGQHETIVLNIADVANDQLRINIMMREAIRIGAKYMFMYQFGDLSAENSTHDFETTPNQTNPPGFTLSLIMQTEEKLLMGGKSWKLAILPDNQVQLQVFATFEGNPGLPSPNARALFEQIFNEVPRKKLKLLETV